MRAARLVSVGKTVLEEVATPVPGPGDLLVRIAACGICGSDRHMFRGEYPTALPVALATSSAARSRQWRRRHFESAWLNPLTHGRAAAMIASGALELDRLITPTIPLAEVPAAVGAVPWSGKIKILAIPDPPQRRFLDLA